MGHAFRPELDTKFRHRGTDYVVLRYAKLPNSLRAGCAQFFQRENGEGLVLSGFKDHPDRSVAMTTGAFPSVSSGTEQHRKPLDPSTSSAEVSTSSRS